MLSDLKGLAHHGVRPSLAKNKIALQIKIKLEIIVLHRSPLNAKDRQYTEK